MRSDGSVLPTPGNSLRSEGNFSLPMKTLRDETRIRLDTVGIETLAPPVALRPLEPEFSVAPPDLWNSVRRAGAFHRESEHGAGEET